MKGTLSLIGRDKELDELKEHLDDAVAGYGSTTLVSGEAGIGKTRLIEEFRKYADTRGANVLSGSGALDSAHPYLVFSQAFVDEEERILFYEDEFASFTEIIAVSHSGLLIAKATPEGKKALDTDIIAGMLTAIITIATKP